MRRLASDLLADLKQARERLGQNPTNSSAPSGSRAPWLSANDDQPPPGDDTPRNDKAPPDDEAPPAGEPREPTGDPAPPPPEAPAPPAAAEEPPKRKPGKQKGAPGFGRTQKLPITHTEHHLPQGCAVCARAFAPSHSERRAWTAFFTLDLLVGEATKPGLELTHTKHIYYELGCPCGHWTRREPHRAPKDELWENVGLTEWRLLGPMLCTFIVALSFRKRLSRRLVQELLREWLHLSLSVGTLQRCVEEAARAAEPVEDALVEEVLDSLLLHADETSLKERTQALWLWVFVTSQTVLYFVGHRTKEMVTNLLGDDYLGWLMSDGYAVYRDYCNRLRCWAHLLRKAKGLEDSLDQTARAFGRDTRALLDTLIAAVYRAREGPHQNLALAYHRELEAFRARCQGMETCAHEKARALAVEFLNDWEAIFAVLEHPHLPLTNNEAERALRHWVIWRRITYGTRSPVGSRTLALLASVIDTCRRRQVSPWPYLAEVITAARQGRDVPTIPTAA